MRFTSGCREGHTEIAFTATGTNLQLVFDHSPYNNRGCDFQKENGKVFRTIGISKYIYYVAPSASDIISDKIFYHVRPPRYRVLVGILIPKDSSVTMFI